MASYGSLTTTPYDFAYSETTMTWKPRDNRAEQEPWNSLAEISTGDDNESTSTDRSTTVTPAIVSSQSDTCHMDC